MFDITGKKAIVTGAGRGIGLELAKALAENGAHVAMIDIEGGIVGTAAALEANRGPDTRVFGIAADLTDRAARKSAFDKSVEALGGLDILVNNAGLQIKGAFLEYPDDAWDTILELNLSCAFALMKYAGRIMREQGSGKIINMASMNSFLGGTQCPAYAATKAGIAQLTKSGANELGVFGINVNAIAPGFIETELTRHIREDGAAQAAKTSRIPMGRWGSPADLRGTLVFLASGASDYICGAVIPVDGGYLCK